MDANHKNIHIQIDPVLTAEEVALRILSGWDGDQNEWESCLTQNLCNVSARTADGAVVGVGFASGNSRRADIADLVVHPNWRQMGIGGKILDALLDYTTQQKIKYVGLAYDTSSPWLREFYEKHGFQDIDFAMWTKASLKNL